MVGIRLLNDFLLVIAAITMIMSRLGFVSPKAILEAIACTMRSLQLTCGRAAAADFLAGDFFLVGDFLALRATVADFLAGDFFLVGDFLALRATVFDVAISRIVCRELALLELLQLFGSFEKLESKFVHSEKVIPL